MWSIKMPGKPSGVTIIQITAATSTTARGGGIAQVFGLGDDQNIYQWINDAHEWVLFA